MGVVEFVKASEKEPPGLAGKYQAAAATFVVLAPDGKIIGSFDMLSGNLTAMVTTAKTAIDNWLDHQPGQK